MNCIKETLDQAGGRIDRVVIMLDTNDTQNHLWVEGDAKGVGRRMDQLMKKIEAWRPGVAPPPRIMLVAPPEPLRAPQYRRFLQGGQRKHHHHRPA